MLEATTTGTAIRHTSSSCHDTMASTITDSTSSSPFMRNMTRPICTSSANESTSEVIREISTPAFSRS